MRDRRVRLGFLALIFAIPWLIHAMAGMGTWAEAPPSTFPHSPFAPAALACQIEAVLGAGLLFAALERRRLLACGLGASDRT